MGGIKVFVSDLVEQKFRKKSMAVFGYQKGSISSAAEQAFDSWSNNVSLAEQLVELPKDPVSAIKGLLSHVKSSGVELQHEASRLIAQKQFKKARK